MCSNLWDTSQFYFLALSLIHLVTSIHQCVVVPASHVELELPSTITAADERSALETTTSVTFSLRFWWIKQLNYRAQETPRWCIAVVWQMITNWPDEWSRTPWWTVQRLHPCFFNIFLASVLDFSIKFYDMWQSLTCLSRMTNTFVIICESRLQGP